MEHMTYGHRHSHKSDEILLHSYIGTLYSRSEELIYVLGTYRPNGCWMGYIGLVADFLQV